MTAVTTAVRVGGKKFIILDYSVPDSLKKVASGWGVICPLRDKLFDGIVLEVKDSPEDSNLKPIQGLVGEGPVVPPDLLLLVQWISENYLVDLTSAIALAFPPFARGQWVDSYKIIANEDDLKPLTGLEPASVPVVKYMLEKKQFSLGALEANFGPELAAFCLRWLLEAGFITQDRKYREARHRRLQGNMVALQLDDPETFIQENKRAYKQLAVVNTLLRHHGKLPLEVLMKETGAAKAILRQLINKNAIKVFNSYEPWEKGPGSFQLTSEQEACLGEITSQLEAKSNREFLLHGVTGSGKTEVYVRAAEYAAKHREKVIVIVPEIALSSQIIRYFQRSFGLRAVILHSKLSSTERYQTWKSIRSGEADVVIGTRSAVFAPFSKIGLIIIDEEHDKSLKQESSPRYHCVEVARERCRINDAVLLLGSATPSLETLVMCRTGSLKRLEMPHRIGGSSPVFKLVDMRRELRKGNTTILSTEVQTAVKERLSRGEQVIAFLNRRGYAGFVNCHSCGHVFRCEHCDIALTYHARNNSLKCHYCGYSANVPTACPVCGRDRMKAFGLGTEKVEEAFSVKFPQAKILRLDSDTTARAGAHDKIVGAFMTGEYDILVGTQMVTKGFDFPGVTLVCVIAADMDLNLPDFRAEERTFQLLTQVGGRAGRREKQGTVIIQTYDPDRPGIALLEQEKQKDFYAGELNRRKELDYPPYSRLVRLLFTGKDEADTLRSAERAACQLSDSQISYIGPAPAPIERIRDVYRWHLIIKGFTGGQKGVLQKILEEERKRFSNKVNIIIDVDPQSLM